MFLETTGTSSISFWIAVVQMQGVAMINIITEQVQDLHILESAFYGLLKDYQTFCVRFSGYSVELYRTKDSKKLPIHCKIYSWKNYIKWTNKWRLNFQIYRKNGGKGLKFKTN